MDKEGACKQAMGLGFTGSASGKDAMEIQERIAANHVRGVLHMTIAGYVTAVIFAILAVLLVIFGPADRIAVTYIFAGAFALLAAGIGGFTNLGLKLPGFSLDAGQADKQPKRKKLAAAG